MKLVIGLGNPGRRYAGSRHNVGFTVIECLAGKAGAGPAKAKFHGELREVELAGQRAILLCPLTYMNLSGLSAVEAAAFYKIPHEDLLVICDDMSLPLGKMRFRARGSSGGQKGLENIIQRLGTEEFSRLRLGVGAAPANWDWADYVLSKFGADELPVIAATIAAAAEAVIAWASRGIEHCMNQYN